jgi:mycoredoxin
MLLKTLRVYLLYLTVLSVCLMGGLALGPHAHAVYGRLFPEPAFIAGDFSAIYREAGKPVVVFSTSTCPHCRHLREFLAREHVDYRDYVVDESAAAEKRFRELNGDGVPLLFIGARRVVGFDERTVRESLALTSPGTSG